MKRRLLLVRTLTGAMSATVFTATGWLMGTRTLTMPTCPNCNPGEICGLVCQSYGPTCVALDCVGACRNYWTHSWGCTPTCPSCECAVTHPMDACGSCTYPCLN